MALPKKGRRSIIVDGKAYVYLIKRSLTAECDLTVQEDCEKPGRCVQYVSHDTLTPAKVADIIRRAIKQGWNPSGKKSNFWIKD